MTKSGIRIDGPITFGEAYQIYHAFIRTGWRRANNYKLYANNRDEEYTLCVDYNPEEELSLSCAIPRSVKLNHIAHKNIHSLSTYKRPKWRLPFMTHYELSLEQRGAGYDGFIAAKSEGAIDEIILRINEIITPPVRRVGKSWIHIEI